MTWGGPFAGAYEAASGAARKATDQALSSASAAADAMARVVQTLKNAGGPGNASPAPYVAAKQVFAPLKAPGETLVAPCAGAGPGG